MHRVTKDSSFRGWTWTRNDIDGTVFGATRFQLSKKTINIYIYNYGRLRRACDWDRLAGLGSTHPVWVSPNPPRAPHRFVWFFTGWIRGSQSISPKDCTQTARNFNLLGVKIWWFSLAQSLLVFILIVFDSVDSRTRHFSRDARQISQGSNFGHRYHQKKQKNKNMYVCIYIYMYT